MNEREGFGPNLRRIRVQRGVTLAQLAEATKVSVDLWAGLERNDLSRWPSGIYARSYVRTYASHIGVDPEATVDDFCRWFPQGDRRAERVVREQAALVGHDLKWHDQVLADVAEDRRSGTGPSERVEPPPLAFTQTGRVVAAIADLFGVAFLTAVVDAVISTGWAASLAVCAVAYHGVSLVALGSTPSVWAIETYLSHRHPTTRSAGTERFLRLLRHPTSEI